MSLTVHPNFCVLVNLSMWACSSDFCVFFLAFDGPFRQLVGYLGTISI